MKKTITRCKNQKISQVLLFIACATTTGLFVSCSDEGDTLIKPIFQLTEDMTLKEKCVHIEQAVIDARNAFCHDDRRPLRAIGEIDGADYCCLFSNPCDVSPAFSELHWRRMSRAGDDDDRLCADQLSTQGYSDEELNTYFQQEVSSENYCLPRNHKYTPRESESNGLLFDSARADILVRYEASGESITETAYTYQCANQHSDGNTPVEICAVDTDNAIRFSDCPADKVESYIYDPNGATPESFRITGRVYKGTLTRDTLDGSKELIYDISDGVATTQ